MARENDISGLGATVITVAPGATNAILVQPVTTQANLILKVKSGTFIIFGIPGGQSLLTLAQGGSLVGTSLVAGASFGYQLGQTETLSIQGNPNFLVSQDAGGSTGTLFLLTGKCGQFS